MFSSSLAANTTGVGLGGLRRGKFSSSVRTGTYIREIGHNLYAHGPFARTLSGSTKTIIFGPWTSRLGHDHQVQSRGLPCGDGGIDARRKHPSLKGRSLGSIPGRRFPPPTAQFRQPTDALPGTRRATSLISDGIHQLACRQVPRQRTARLGETMGHPRQQAPANSTHRRQHRVRCAGQHLRGRSRQPAHPGFRSRDGTFLAPDHYRRCRCSPVVHMWMGNPPPTAAAPAATVGMAPPNGTMQSGSPWAICRYQWGAGPSISTKRRRLSRTNLQA